jgi:hypothetical protein
LRLIITFIVIFSNAAAIAGSGNNITIGFGKSVAVNNPGISGNNIKLQVSIYRTPKTYWVGGLLGSSLQERKGSLMGTSLTYMFGEYYDIYGGVGHQFIKFSKYASISGAISLHYQYGEERFGMKPPGWWDAYLESRPQNSIGLGGHLSFQVPILPRLGTCFLLDYRIFSASISPQRNYELGLSYMFGKRNQQGKKSAK